jgi:hypothetical protein
MTEPLLRSLQRQRVQRALMDTPVDGARHQSRLFEHAYVPRDCWQGHCKWLRKFRDHRRCLGETPEQSTSRAMAKGMENRVQMLLIRNPARSAA